MTVKHVPAYTICDGCGQLIDAPRELIPKGGTVRVIVMLDNAERDGWGRDIGTGLVTRVFDFGPCCFEDTMQVLEGKGAVS